MNKRTIPASCGLLTKLYLGIDKNSDVRESFADMMLWFAYKVVSWYRQKQYIQILIKLHYGCGLLTKLYLGIDKNSRK